MSKRRKLSSDFKARVAVEGRAKKIDPVSQFSAQDQ